MFWSFTADRILSQVLLLRTGLVTHGPPRVFFAAVQLPRSSCPISVQLSEVLVCPCALVCVCIFSHKTRAVFPNKVNVFLWHERRLRKEVHPGGVSMDRGWIRIPKIWLEVSEGRLFCSACSVYLGAHSGLSAVLNNRAVSSQIRMVKKST